MVKTFKLYTDYKTEKIVVAFEDEFLYVYTKDGNYKAKFLYRDAVSNCRFQCKYSNDEMSVILYYTRNITYVKGSIYNGFIKIYYCYKDHFQVKYYFLDYNQRLKFNNFFINKFNDKHIFV